MFFLLSGCTGGRLEELDVGGGDFDGGGKEAGELD